MAKRKLLQATGTVLPMLLLSGCMQFELSAEELMRPPALSSEQLEISSALEQAVGDSDIKYKYPETGDHRSSFIFYDLDGDGDEEAMAFYQAESKGSSTWVNILDRRDDRWVSLYDISAPNNETEIDFISFQPLVSDENSIIIGWANEYMNEKCAVVYSYDGQTMKKYYEEDYSQLCFMDLDNNGKLDMLSVYNDDFDEKCIVSYIIRDSNISGATVLKRQSIIELYYDSTELLSVQAGKIDVTTPALFIDSKIDISRDTHMYLTQIVTVEDGRLADLLYNGETSLCENTLRPTSTVCQDINDDGVMEVPTVVPLPGYEDSEEALYMTQFNQLSSSQGWVPVRSVVINEDQRYQLTLPDRWIGSVTIHSQPESKEWSFVRYGANLEDSSSLLLRLKVYSSKDYHDKFESGYFELLGTQGLFEYYAHIPEASDSDEDDSYESLYISERELNRLFAFID